MPTNIEMCDCESSRIARHGYCAETNRLALQFKGKGGAPGPVYYYADFPPEEYEAMKCCDSLGKFFGSRINVKNDDGTLKYPFTKVPDEPEPA